MQVRRTHPDSAGDADPAHEELAVTGLVLRARNGDKQAWDALVERYAPLIWSICRKHRLDDADAADAGQSVWLRLVEQLHKIRDAAALPGWLATTTRRECGRVLRTAQNPHAAGYPPGTQNMPDEQGVTAEHQLLAAEAHAALHEAVSHLPPRYRQLIAVLTEDPSPPTSRAPPGNRGAGRLPGGESRQEGKPGIDTGNDLAPLLQREREPPNCW